MADDPTVPEPATASDIAPVKDERPPAALVPAPALPTIGPAVADAGYTESGVPTLEGVRDKIETRLGNAMGATELAQDTPEVRTATERYESRRQAAVEKLQQIRASMHESD